MKYIEQITISKFRSIGTEESFETLDLNIFSGSNDSGKSNYLKALNLFFTGHSELNIRYSSESDFNKWYRDNNIRGERNIEIEVKIAKGNYGDKDGINQGFIAKKIFRVDGGQEFKFADINGMEILPGSKSHNKANGVITEKFRYVYIPAIRDAKFRENLQQLIQEIAKSTDKRFKSQDLKEAFEKMELGIDSQLKELTSYVKSLMNIDIETNVNFSTLLESLSFETSEKIIIKKRGKNLEKQRINLRNRGDGIQMQFFSFLLWFISKNDKKHFYIWGYEEPEIAFEFKRQFELAEIFKDTFCKVAQIFITTHSPAFAFSDSDRMTKVFRVSYEKEKNFKNERYLSKVVPMDLYYEGLFKELTTASVENKKLLERDIWGINAQKISKMIGESLNEVIGLRQISNNQLDELKDLIKLQQVENTSLKVDISKIEDELINLFPEKVFICEDEKAINLWEKMLHEKANIANDKFKVIASKGCTNNQVETALCHLMSQNTNYRPKVFRQLDRDGYTSRQIEFLENAKAKHSEFQKFQKYKVIFLPVNEIENFAVQIDSDFTEEKLKDFNTFSIINDAFVQTVNSNLLACLKLCKIDSDRALFNGKLPEMTKEARLNMLKYFPGKEIKKTKANFNCDKTLLDKEFSDLPSELRAFLLEIKSFFEN
ncbi:ATP-dependent nuclease [Pedobacter suwonensis]|uniref:ATP-dependent nuclease n=1 Tax=Pedobacter suwonensis TaxID=332999 RepID=UPI0011A54412|nr:AAA family ATPase [Pedobacter suwonensis]